MQRSARRAAQQATQQATHQIETETPPTFRMEFQKFLDEIGIQRMIPERDLSLELQAARDIFERAAQALRGDVGSEELLGRSLEASRAFLQKAIEIGDINEAVSAQAAIERLGGALGLRTGEGGPTAVPAGDVQGEVQRWGAQAGLQRSAMLQNQREQTDALQSMDRRLERLENRGPSADDQLRGRGRVA
jgi:hypothetical protein